MMAGRLPQRVRGEGWEVWLDPSGILWTTDTRPMDGETAAVRIQAMERFLTRRPVVGVVVDDRDPAGADAPEAVAQYRRFLERHPGLPVAVVTDDKDALESALVARRPGAPLALFSSPDAALEWIRRVRDQQRPRGVWNVPAGSGANAMP